MQGYYYEAGEEKNGMFLYNIITKERTLLSEKSIYWFTNMGNRVLVGVIETDEFRGIGILDLNTNETKCIYSFERLDEDLPASDTKIVGGVVRADKDLNKFKFIYSNYLAEYDALNDQVTVLEQPEFLGYDIFLDEENQVLYYSYTDIMAYHFDTKSSNKVLDVVSMDTIFSNDGTMYYADRRKGMICKYDGEKIEDLVNLNLKFAYLNLNKDESRLLYFTAVDLLTGTYTPVVMQYDFETGKRQELYRPAPNEWVQQAVWDD